MAGFRFKLEEKSLLISIIKAAISTFTKQAQDYEKKELEVEFYGAKHNAQVASDILAKIEGNFTATES